MLFFVRCCGMKNCAARNFPSGAGDLIVLSDFVCWIDLEVEIIGGVVGVSRLLVG